MGLLSRALEKIAQAAPLSELDESGKKIRDRILRITPGADVPYTALGLLTEYGSFDAGICLHYIKKNYESYASVGLSFKTVSVPENYIYKKEKNAHKFFKLFDNEKKLFDFMDPDLNIWCFPLDKKHPWGAVMLLGTHGTPSIDPRTMPVLLKDIHKIIYPRKK